MKSTETYTTTAIMARFIRFVKPYSLFVFCFLFVSFINIFTSLSEGYLVKNIINSAIDKNTEKALFYIYIMIPIAVLGIIITYLLKFLYSYFSSNAMKDFRLHLYQHFQKFPVSYFEKRHTGDLLSRFNNDASSVQEFFGHELLNLFLDTLLFTAAFIYMASINWKLLLFSIFLSPPALLAVHLLTNRVKKYSKMNHEITGKANVLVQDMVSGIAIVKAYNMKESISKKFEAESKNALKYALRELRVNTYTSPFHVMLRMIPTVMCATYGGYLTLRGQLNTGELMAFIYLLGYVSWPLAFLIEKINKIKGSAGAAERVVEVLESPCERVDGTHTVDISVNNAIEFEDVIFSYEEGVNVLDKFNLSIEKGKKIAIVGPSGCGKSTVIKLLCDFNTPKEGAVKIFGQNIKEVNVSKVRYLISLVTQDTYLYPGSIMENISYGCTGATLDEIVDAAKAANAYEFIIALPEGFNTNVGERGVKLSGGQKQRIAVARAVLKKAPILLLDEPTSALDTESEALVQSALDSIMEQKTSIIVAHRFSTIKDVDEILVMDNGRIVERGKHEELIKMNGSYKQLYEKQFSKSEECEEISA